MGGRAAIGALPSPTPRPRLRLWPCQEFAIREKPSDQNFRFRQRQGSNRSPTDHPTPQSGQLVLVAWNEGATNCPLGSPNDPCSQACGPNDPPIRSPASPPARG